MNLIPGQEHEGMIYVGTLLNEKNEPYGLLVEKEDRGEMDWDDAIKTGALPTIEELNLMRANHKLLNMIKCYWSSTEYKLVYSWVQGFTDGYQNTYHKCSSYMVRCVRRLALQSFDSLKGEKMENYSLIKKWLGLEVFWISTCSVPVIDADKLEAKLAEGFEVYATNDSDFGMVAFQRDTLVALAIGKQPIKKQTQAEAALELLKYIVDIHENSYDGDEEYAAKAKKILEMKEE